jgi:AhpC/TSA family
MFTGRRAAMQIIAWFLFVALAGAAVCAATPSARIQLQDLSGHSVDPLEAGGKKATVFVFVRTDCPISNRYAPLLHRIYTKFSPKGVNFWLVYVDPRQTAKAIEEHLREYVYGFEALQDPKHELVKLTGAEITPEAIVFVPGNSTDDGGTSQRIVYRGRIDDQYVAFGITRPAPTTHDLENVLEKVIEGKPLKETTTKAVGCFISDLD